MAEQKMTARDLHYRDKEATYFLREVEGITFPAGEYVVTETHSANMMSGWWFTVEYRARWGGQRGQVFVPGETVLRVEVKA